MNLNTDNHVPPFEDPAHEREWLAQERARQCERLQLDGVGEDARSQSYRLLARALRAPLPETLPAQFAQRVAACAAAGPAKRVLADSRFELVLTLALGLVLIAAAGTTMTIYAGAWLPAFHALLPAPQAPASGWLLALAGCLGASWLCGQWEIGKQP